VAVIDDAAVRAAISEFPQLRALVDLATAGWRFATGIHDGEVTSVHGVYAWPDGSADAIGVLSATDVQGVRADHTGHIVWKREGRLTDVVYGLLELPAPGLRTAPRLARGIAPALWHPGGWS
jgi:hypothetical protein